MLHRENLKTLESWYKRDKRKPLIIRGARQVGKTTLVRMFSENQNLQLIEINCEKPWSFLELVEELNPEKMIQAIEFELNIKINPETSLIFFDEVQATPRVLLLLRYFYEEAPEYKVVTTGSLLEFVLDEPQFSIPVGRLDFLYMLPLSFEEFLIACKETPSYLFIKNYSIGDDIPNYIHKKLTKLLRKYVALGGMPEVVYAYVNKLSILDLERIKNSIIDTYKLDFNKYKKSSNSKLLTIVFNSLPNQIGRKIKYSNIDRAYKSNEISKALNHLSLARVVSKVYNTGCNGVPLGAEKKENYFKCFLLDIGLIHTQLKLNTFETDSAADLNYINSGVLSEQLIAGQLYHQSPDFIEPELYYWSRDKKGSSSEVDFVISDKNRNIIPIEVKSGSTGSLKSLHVMVVEKSLTKAVRFNSDIPSILNEKRGSVKGDIDFILYSVPHYLSGQIIRLLDEL